MKISPLFFQLAVVVVLSAFSITSGMARGGFRGGGERMDVDRDVNVDRNVEFQRGEGVDRNTTYTGEDGREADINVDHNGHGQTNVDATGPDGKSANAEVQRYGDGVAHVSATGPDGHQYDANVYGPEGFRNGYVWRDDTYVRVNLDPMAPYLVPYGAFAGWSIITEPAYIEYPVYATYPIETAVEIKLAALGFYMGEIDGLLPSVAPAIEAYQESKGLPVTGTINQALLASLGIQTTEG